MTFVAPGWTFTARPVVDPSMHFTRWSKCSGPSQVHVSGAVSGRRGAHVLGCLFSASAPSDDLLVWGRRGRGLPSSSATPRSSPHAIPVAAQATKRTNGTIRRRQAGIGRRSVAMAVPKKTNPYHPDFEARIGQRGHAGPPALHQGGGVRGGSR